jgi:hypothetical protein
MRTVLLALEDTALRGTLRGVLEKQGIPVEDFPAGSRLTRALVILDARSPQSAVSRLRQLRGDGHDALDVIVCAPFDSISEEDAFVDEHEIAVLPLPLNEKRLLDLLGVLEDQTIQGELSRPPSAGASPMQETRTGDRSEDALEIG